MTDREILLSVINAEIGKPYRWGGDRPTLGFDCSGLVSELLLSIGAIRGRMNSESLQEYFRTKGTVLRPEELSEFGDLLFFGRGRTDHVALAVNPFVMFEAGGGGKNTTTLAAAEEQNAFVRFRRIDRRSDLLERIRFLT